MDRRLLALLCAATLAIPGTSRTIYLEQVPPTNEELSFMQRYGYLPSAGEGEASSFTPDSIAEAVRLLQGFAGLPRTGVLDGETKKVFKKKRCGVKDIIEAAPSRRRRYVIQQGWNKKSISYRVLNGSSTLGKERVEALMAKGLALWAPHVGLKFHREDTGEADIEVSFASWDHGDGFPFDGLGGVMAHAFCPPYGAMHFDDDEVWGELDDEDEDATDFFAVAVHEIGHALGMAHSAVKSSVMYPYYQPTVARLHADDISGMRELYSKQPAGSEEQTESPVVPRSSLGPGPTQPDDDVPDLCFTNYDTIQVLQGKIYVFEEEWMWALNERKVVVEGYPKRFRDVFAGLPASVNVVRTVYEKRNGNIVIFADKRYWEFGSNFRLINRGRLSDYSLPPSLPELTSVFVSNYNNKTYLISDERFWRYDEGTRTMDQGYPKEMSAWRDLPYPVDAALVWQGDTYFFRGPRFWRFDNDAIRTHPYYPLPTALVWFQCEPAADTERYTRNED
ncbi:hypothetical protein MSG28_003683 [Choristoneura fumiferana]|uniref:Uncharacterized protein n=1 Tax=Choristoneura fumiferana TaxID=7141 RepID=A0ACC0KFT0_CHOFU|nr:hypothetical protein MSG28_003683 [Choristoneura fumiferana]